MSSEICGDNRFEIIEAAKKDILERTNIETSPKEMEVIDSILFRAWQMGWLKEYDSPPVTFETTTIMQEDEFGDLVPTLSDMKHKGFKERDRVKVQVTKI